MHSYRYKGIAPRARIEGNVDTTFTYTTAHVEYMYVWSQRLAWRTVLCADGPFLLVSRLPADSLGELLKNSFRATVERHGGTALERRLPCELAPACRVSLAPCSASYLHPVPRITLHSLPRITLRASSTCCFRAVQAAGRCPHAGEKRH